MKKLCIIGNMRHGKDSVAEMLQKQYGYTFESSSQAAARIFIYDKLKDLYGYTSPEQCFEDRVNHRKEWYDMICEYNLHDKAALARDIMLHSDIYVGMRSNEELEVCLSEGIFDLVIGVFDPRKPLESLESNNIDFWGKADIVIPNAGTLEDLGDRVYQLESLLRN